jgi:hypothetical protein
MAKTRSILHFFGLVKEKLRKQQSVPYFSNEDEEKKKKMAWDIFCY